MVLSLLLGVVECCEDKTEGKWDRGTCPWVQKKKSLSMRNTEISEIQGKHL